LRTFLAGITGRVRDVPVSCDEDSWQYPLPGGMSRGSGTGPLPLFCHATKKRRKKGGRSNTFLASCQCSTLATSCSGAQTPRGA